MSDPSLKALDIMNAILVKKPQFAACFAAEHAASGVTGKLLLVWDILPSGEPANIGVRDSDYAALELSHCVARAVATCRFASSHTGAQTFVFPFKY